MEQFNYFVTHLLSPEGFPPRWFCGEWSSFHGWLYIISNLGVWSAYMCIPFVLLYFMRKRKDLPFPKVFALFALFIFACGTTHLIDATMFWWPVYRLSAIVLAGTAIVSWWTIFTLADVMPLALKLRSPEELEREIQVRTSALLSSTRELQESEARKSVILESARDAFITINLWGCVIEWNQAAEEILGYTRSEALGRELAELIIPEQYRESHRHGLKYFQETGEGPLLGKRIEMPALRKDGTEFSAELSITKVPLEGEILFTGTLRDITDRKKSETALLDSEARMRAVLESSADAIITIDENAMILSFNHTATRLFGYSQEEIIGQNVNILMPSPYKEEHDGYVKNYLETGINKIIGIGREVVGRRKNGSVFPIELSVSEVLLKDQRIFTGIIRDITERKQAERKIIQLTQNLEKRIQKRTAKLREEIALRQKTEKSLRLSEERFRLIVTGVRDYAIYMLDPGGKVITWNEGAEKITGYSAEEIIGQNMSVFYTSDEILAGSPSRYLKISAKEGRTEHEGWRLRKDGTSFWANIVITAIRNPEGRLLGFSKITRDLTEKKSLEEQLVLHTKQLEAVNKELESFSYSVSHDLRAPLRTIDGFSQAVVELYADKLDERGQNYLYRVRQGSQDMAKLIDDMLQLSRMTRDVMNIETIDLSEIARDITDRLQEEEPRRQVVFDIADKITVQGDKRLLRVVLQNLFDNAWKFTSHHAQANIHFGKIQSDSQSVYFVKDDGAGFDMQYTDKLFGAFQRLHSTNSFPGTGVGLATVARIIHRHGGEVWAEAEVEKGATFYFTLQLANTEERINAGAEKAYHLVGGG